MHKPKRGLKKSYEGKALLAGFGLINTENLLFAELKRFETHKSLTAAAH